MPTPPRILAATDFSPPSRRAVLRAATLAAATGGRLDIVHAAHRIEPSLIAWLRGKPGAAAALAAADRRIDEAVVLAERLGVPARGHIVVGAPVPTLEAEVRRLKSGVVVVGARGSNKVRDFLLGTTAERLIERLPCDVLVARRAAGAPYRKILVCVDESPAAAQALRRVATLGAAAQLHVVHAYEPPLESILRGSQLRKLASEHRQAERQRARAAIDEFLASTGVAVDRGKLLVQSGRPLQVIERAIGRVAPDLIAIGHHTSVLGGMFLGSVAKQVLRIAGCDVLVTHG